MLLATVSIWAFGFTVARYAVTHGFEPLAYSALRFSCAAVLVSGITYGMEHTLRFKRRHLALLVGAAFIGIYLNQLGFIYAIDLTNASTTALIFGSLPILTAIFAYARRRGAPPPPLLDRRRDLVRRGRRGRARGRRRRLGELRWATCSPCSAPLPGASTRS